MHSYGVRDVEKLLRLPRSTIRSLIEAGFVSPARGPRNSWRFSFQDLIVLRTAEALAAANVPRRRAWISSRSLSVAGGLVLTSGAESGRKGGWSDLRRRGYRCG